MSDNQIPKTEEDRPKNITPITFEVNQTNTPEKNDRDWFNTVKGHHLLGWCVCLFILIYVIETIFHGGRPSQTAEVVIEILKLLTFSLTGYLFGTNGNKH